MWGLSRSLVNNLVVGVSEGFAINLEIQGVGYRAAVQGKSLKLDLGYSHQVQYPIPEGINIACEKPTLIRVQGADRQQVGQVAAGNPEISEAGTLQGKRYTLRGRICPS